jgi:Mrp family chromosome partitioning ATPase
MGAGLRAADLVITSPGSSFAAAVAQLLSGILAASAPPATIVITAMTPGAGKTTLALALARAAAQAGIKTIVVDANRPACHLGAMTGRTAAVLSWPEAFARPGAADDFIASDPLSPALVMADDPHLIGYESVLAPPVLARLIANFKTSLDLVIVAAPPISDALAPSVLALADMLLVAVDSRRPTLPVRMPRLALTVFTHAR